MFKMSIEKLLWELYECDMEKCKDVSIGDIMLLEDVRYGLKCDELWCEDGKVWCGDDEDGYKLEIRVKLKGLSENGAKWICKWYEDGAEKIRKRNEERLNMIERMRG